MALNERMSMTNTRPTKLAPWALALSLTAHALLIAPQLHFTALSIDEEPKVVKVSLVMLPKLQPSTPPTPNKPVKPTKQKKKPLPPPVATPQPTMDVSAENIVAVSAEPPPYSPSATSIAAAEASGIPAETKEDIAPAPSPSAETAPPPVPDTKPPLHLPPVNVEIEFALLKGTNGLKVGRATHTWQITNDTYVIRNIIEATGIFSLARPGQLVQTSQGKITADGLAPEHFTDQRGKSADRTFSAQFDRQQQTLTYGRASEMTTVPLPPQTQDLLSFVYQFTLHAPFTEAVQFSMTNGRKIGSYTYQVIGEETLETGLGKLQTLHLSKVHQPADEGAEVWLAKDHQYLPVKIRLTDKKGGVAEQIVTAIRTR